jgi:HSP20 family protein
MASSVTLPRDGRSTDVVQREATRDVVYTPRVDILETAEELILFADLPGVKPEDADVRFENGELVLQGRCQPRHPEVGNLLQEYSVGDFYRVFAVSQDIDADKIAAELKNGVLTVHLPKAEAVKPKKIAVKGK